MNIWTQMSIDFANQRNYLDELFKVYPISPNLRRVIPNNQWNKIEIAYNAKNNKELLKELFKLDLFPIKDSYVAYLKRDPSSIDRNPNTIDRIAGNIYALSLSEVYDKCSEPKETNRQIGPMFKNWIDKKLLGVEVFKNIKDFIDYKGNCVLNVSDAEMKKFAIEYLGYTRNKGLDFIARFNNKYILGEAKFLTDFGGHQNAQFDDAVSTMTSTFITNNNGIEIITIAIMDGVLYIKGNNKMYSYLKEHDEQIIISSLLLREFLFSL